MKNNWRTVKLTSVWSDLAIFYSRYNSSQLAATDRSEWPEQLLVKRVEVETEKLFRVLLLAILYILRQHGSEQRNVAQERTSKCLSCLFSFIASYMYSGSDESTALCSSLSSSSSLDFPRAACCSGCCVESGSFASDLNSSKNLTVASTSGIAPLPVPGSPSPRCTFRSPSSLNRFQNGGECSSSYDTAFAEHILRYS